VVGPCWLLCSLLLLLSFVDPTNRKYEFGKIIKGVRLSQQTRWSIKCFFADNLFSNFVSTNSHFSQFVFFLLLSSPIIFVSSPLLCFGCIFSLCLCISFFITEMLPVSTKTIGGCVSEYAHLDFCNNSSKKRILYSTEQLRVWYHPECTIFYIYNGLRQRFSFWTVHSFVQFPNSYFLPASFPHLLSMIC
jgi:hypothetical protein